MELSSSQREAVRAFRAYLESPARVFMLKGAAGTGKTTVVSQFIEMLKDMKRECVLMAPTGRAAHIIRTKTGHPASTIHRGIYSLDSINTSRREADESAKSADNAAKEEDSDGYLHARFGLRRNEHLLSTVYIVDEASMVSDSGDGSGNESFSFGSGRLLHDLFQYIGERKIVFVGDPAQLPPVGMNFSPALDRDYISDTFGYEVTETTLKEVMRQQEGSMILANAGRIRDCIEAKSFIEFSLKEGSDTESERIDLLNPYYRISPSGPNRKAAIVTYSNRQALDYNLAVRRHYFGEAAPRLIPGDLLIIARNNYAYEYELFNGNIVLVDSCAGDADIERRIVRIKTGKERVESVELRFRKAVVRFSADGKAVSLPVTILDNFLDAPEGALGGLLARALVVDFERRLPESIKSRLSEIRKILRRGERLSIELMEIHDAYKRLLMTDAYYNAVICKYGYAMTCHKAQGGEWPSVFVDMGRYGGTANEDYFRWAYTALTRASEKLWHFRSPDFSYISRLVVEPIQESRNIKVSLYSAGSDFRKDRAARIREAAARAGLTVSEDTSRNYQHWIIFYGNNGENITFILWYKAKGYSDRMEIRSSGGSEELASLCRTIIEDSHLPETVPFSCPGRPFAEKLVEFFKSQFAELGIGLLDITHEQYQDVFHVKTDGIAKIILQYTDKGNYTYMKPVSSLGQADSRLELFRQRFL